MDPDQQRIEEDLRGLLQGDVRCDDVFAQLYATDASLYELRPLGVVRPRTLDDVVATVRYAAENNISLHARGAGTGLAGESLGRGLVVDFSRYLRRIVSDDGQRVRVQPGVVLGSLNRYLGRSGRLFGPDPAMRSITTMGSVVAIDAGGSHWPRYGSARRHVEALQIVLADGTVLRVDRHLVGGAMSNGQAAAEDPATARFDGLIASVAGLIQRHAKTIDEHRPQSLVNRSGYKLDGMLVDGKLDLAKLLVGSEGTLALITEATLTVDELPAHRACVLLLFDSLDKAAHAALRIAELRPTACDLMDRRHLSLARESDVRYELMIPGEAEAMLLVEHHADSRDELEAKLAELIEAVQYREALAAASHVSEDESDFRLFWGLAQRFVPTLHRMHGSTRPVPFVEDIAVPLAAMPVFLRHLQDTLKRLHVTASLFGHAAQGQLHVRPLLDMADDEHVRKMETLANELYEKVWLLRGTISGEHGDGLSRTPFLARQYGPLVNVFRELKRIFDPQGLLNPGLKVPHGPLRLTQNLRPLRGAIVDRVQSSDEANGNGQPPRTFELQLNWQASEIAATARACNGCGACRSSSLDVRMCPIFHMSPREEASPRAKANLMRGVLAGTLPDDTLVQDACKQVADLCVHCHMCRLECPANVDVPKLMLEAKASYVRTNGFSLQDWLLTRIDLVARLAGRLPGLSNWALANPQARWLLEKVLGVAQGRKLPQLARRSFLQQASLRRLHHPPRVSGDKVLYFVDTYANHFDTELAEALVAVLKHNGISVYVPQEQQASAMPMIAAGAVEPAREIAAATVASLAEHIRQGYTIVATEPSAVLALTHEYPLLLNEDEDALSVARHTQEACHYLWTLHQRGRLKLNFQPQRISAGYHVPCHLRALGVGAPAENLLRLVPGVRVTRLEKGCSGMAGLWGARHENYRASLRAGLELISAMRHGPFQIGTTECSTCRIQMEQSSPKPTIHPLKLLALAYGLMPEIAEQVRTHGRPLVLT